LPHSWLAARFPMTSLSDQIGYRNEPTASRVPLTSAFLLPAVSSSFTAKFRERSVAETGHRARSLEHA
jgi:hypothetical protein